jgi:hypothetical protein
MTDSSELTRLQAKLVALEDLRDSGQTSIQYEQRRISYQNGADLRAAIAALKADIAGLSGASSQRRRTFRVHQSGSGY